MSRRSTSAVLIAALAILGVFSSGAMAASTHARATLGAGKRLNRHQVKTAYTATYTDEKWGPVVCKGVHIVSTQYPGTATTGGADKFKCKSTTHKPVTFGGPGEVLMNPTPWASDYFNLSGHFVLAKSLVITMAANVKSYTGLAVYPSPAEEEAQKAKEQKEKEEQEAKEKAEKEQKEKEEKEKEEEEPEV